MRAAVRHRDAERLALADGDVDAERARRLEQRVRMRLGDLHAERASGVRRVRDLANVDERAERVGVLNDEAGRVLGGCRELRGRHLDDLELRPAAVRAQSAAVREVDLGRDDDLLPPGHPNGHERRFGRGRTAVVHGGVHDLHREQLGDERLVLEDPLERALADLGLVRRVRGQKFAAQGEDGHGGGDVAALDRPADEERTRAGRSVHRRETLEVGLHLHLGKTRGKTEPREASVLRDCGEQVIDAPDADPLEHRRSVFFGVRRVRVRVHAGSPALGRKTRTWLVVSLVAARGRGP